ncbi:helix-turn-helix domain-containing protein [Sphingobacterium thalpophilum]|uniref:Transcriptional regulator, y4mF family n=1 Tax=Sphingobacterium thalpophilum TaxID=259 RepID=A0A4U9V2K4_9SPHI|nr:helix-turn-helix transcriptional regulator [Sphingobacterium thalpophilum]VTR36651.1 transcriptional regulator, y4mF family [Sphingobacterium thalpophilum]
MNDSLQDIREKELKILDEIRKQRVRNGFTQEYIAMLLGISQSQYNKMESGIVSVKLGYLIKICRALKISGITFDSNPNPTKSSVDIISSVKIIEDALLNIKNRVAKKE